MIQVNGALIGKVLTPWAGREDQSGEPRYELACADEPSMRNLIRAELLPTLGRWDEASLSSLRIALALALHSNSWRWVDLQSYYTPVPDPVYGERQFWLWVWDELCHEDVPSIEELGEYELVSEPVGDLGLRVAPGPDWHQIFEARKQIRFRLPHA